MQPITSKHHCDDQKIWELTKQEARKTVGGKPTLRNSFRHYAANHVKALLLRQWWPQTNLGISRALTSRKTRKNQFASLLGGSQHCAIALGNMQPITSKHYCYAHGAHSSKTSFLKGKLSFRGKQTKGYSPFWNDATVWLATSVMPTFDWLHSLHHPTFVAHNYLTQPIERWHYSCDQ